MADNKVKENLLRRKAQRLGLQLSKSRAKRWSIDNHLGYMIIDAYLNAVIKGARYDLSIEEVDEYLNWYEQNLREEEG
jgi:hypothetical protein